MNQIPKLLALIILGTTFTGCSLFSSKGNTVTVDSSDATPSINTSDMPIHPTTQGTEKDSQSTVFNTIQSEALEKLNGDWVIVSVNNKKVYEDDDQPYLIFEIGKNIFYASNGCNIINGSFSLDSNGNITFSNVLSSLKSCPQQWYHQAISKVLADGIQVRVKSYEQGNESYIELLSPSGNKLMTLRRHNMESLNGMWIIKEIGERKINNPDINLFLDIPEQKVHGNTGCNYFNGEILIDPMVANSINFSQMAVTMSLCPDTDIEMAMLVALEETHTYHVSHNQLHLLNSSGKILMKLSR